MCHQLKLEPAIGSEPESCERKLARRRTARLGDALIAQSCIDGGVSLLTRDRDFRAFIEAAGLNLVVKDIFRLSQEMGTALIAVLAAGKSNNPDYGAFPLAGED